jgi:hypothetical protein
MGGDRLVKTRSGFVSNSSSSSFVVAIKDCSKTSTRIKIEVEIDLANYSRNNMINSVEDLLTYYINELCMDLEEIKSSKTYQKCKKAIEAGKIILMGSFSSESGEPLEAMLCEYGLNSTCKDSNIEIIEGEGGY